MPQAQVKVVIVRFSGQVGKRHTGHVLENAETELIALVDPSSSALAVKEALGVSIATPLFASVTELLESKELPDGAIVCTPKDACAHCI